MTAMIEALLAGNRRFTETEFRQHLDHYRAIAQQQSPKVLWIGCSDSRVSEDVITGSKPGTIFVHRNVANIVAYNDVNIAAIIEYAVERLRIPDIVVCGHTKCGGIAAIHDGADIEDHYIADWLLIAGGAKEAVDRAARERPLTREERLNLLVEENVRLQIAHLKDLSIIRHRHPPHILPRIHGWVYDVDSGHIKVLVDGSVDGGGGP
jgi:carbonic anhydrase